MKTTSAFFLAAFILANSATLSAETHVVNAQGIIFSPNVLIIKPGDSVHWNTMAVHSVDAVEYFIPEGAVGWESGFGDSFEVTLTQEGIYIYRCKPHQRLAMAGAIIVGKPINIEEIRSQRPDQFLAEVVELALKRAEELNQTD